MPYFPSLPDDAGIGQLWNLNPGIRKPMNDLGKAIMRDDSPLSAGQRETIAAFVSALNKCDYCFKGHIEMAANLGADRKQIGEARVADQAAALESGDNVSSYSSESADNEGAFASDEALQALRDKLASD